MTECRKGCWNSYHKYIPYVQEDKEKCEHTKRHRSLLKDLDQTSRNEKKNVWEEK